jgi:hypothetical protein
LRCTSGRGGSSIAAVRGSETTRWKHISTDRERGSFPLKGEYIPPTAAHTGPAEQDGEDGQEEEAVVASELKEALVVGTSLKEELEEDASEGLEDRWKEELEVAAPVEKLEDGVTEDEEDAPAEELEDPTPGEELEDGLEGELELDGLIEELELDGLFEELDGLIEELDGLIEDVAPLQVPNSGWHPSPQ